MERSSYIHGQSNDVGDCCQILTVVWPQEFRTGLDFRFPLRRGIVPETIPRFLVRKKIKKGVRLSMVSPFLWS